MNTELVCLLGGAGGQKRRLKARNLAIQVLIQVSIQHKDHVRRLLTAPLCSNRHSPEISQYLRTITQLDEQPGVDPTPKYRQHHAVRPESKELERIPDVLRRFRPTAAWRTNTQDSY